MSADLRTDVITINGIRSPYIDAGTPSDEAAVFVHGNPGSSKDWRALVTQVAEFGRAIAIDMPGFGKADKPKDFNYTVAGYSEHLNAALDALGVRRVHLVLHDFGGPWGLDWASGHLDRVSSVTLINTGVLLGYRWHFFARIWRTPVVGEVFMATTSRPAFRMLTRRGNRRLPREYIDQTYNDFDRKTRRAVLKLYRATGDPAGDAERAAAALRPLNLPALVVWGRTDPYIDVAFAERQREVFPRARIVILDDAGHWPFADSPAEVAAAVVPFLREQMTPR
jgi:pimeloyl-ACP methyl ester carboxylesterase